MITIFSRYNRPASPAISDFEHTLAQQQFKEEVDINNIIKRAAQTGDVSIFTPTQRQEFIDSSMYEDYQTALETLGTVEEDFYSLPASVRREFDDDPDKYVGFMSNPANFDKAVELGLLEGSGDKQAMPAKAPEQPAAAPEPSATSEPQA